MQGTREACNTPERDDLPSACTGSGLHAQAVDVVNRPAE